MMNYEEWSWPDQTVLPDLAESCQNGKTVLWEMAKSRRSDQKVQKMEKKGFMDFHGVSRKCYVFELHGLGPLCLRLARRASRRRAVGAGPKGPRRRRLAQGPKGPELVIGKFILFYFYRQKVPRTCGILSEGHFMMKNLIKIVHLAWRTFKALGPYNVKSL